MSESTTTASSSIIARQRERIDLLEEQVRHLQSLLRPEGPIELGAWELSGGFLRFEGHRVRLSRSEHNVTVLIFSRHGRIVTKEMLYDYLYTIDCEAEAARETQIVDVFVCKARGKIKAQTGEQPIRTVWGRGYTWQGAGESE